MAHPAHAARLQVLLLPSVHVEGVLPLLIVGLGCECPQLAPAVLELPDEFDGRNLLLELHLVLARDGGGLELATDATDVGVVLLDGDICRLLRPTCSHVIGLL